MMRINRHRGAFLLLFGTIHVILGSSYLFPPPTAGVTRSLGFLVALGVPVWVAGIPWIASGLAAGAAAFAKTPPGRDGWGFQALIAIEVAWASVYTLSWLFGDYTRGWVLASLFAALAGAVYIVSGMVSAAAILRAREDLP